MKTYDEWRVFLGKLDLSTRSNTILLRAYHEPSEYELKYDSNKGFIWEALKNVETYEDLESAIKMLSGKIRSFGYTCESEVLCAIANLKDNSKKLWHSTKSELPTTGLPLAVKTLNVFDDKRSIKYPVYYVKDPYTFEYKWVFCPVCEAPSILLPDYSDIEKWSYMEDWSEE